MGDGGFTPHVSLFIPCPSPSLMSTWLTIVVVAPVLILWALHELGWNTPVTKALCALVEAATLGHWRPKAEQLDDSATIAVSGAGLAILALLIGTIVS